MNARDAILRAADSIEQQPDRYDFNGEMTYDCGSPACMLGWIGFHAGLRNACNAEVARRVLGIEETGIFYDRIGNDSGTGCPSFKDWGDGPSIAACLREYADKYHPEKTELGSWDECVFKPRGIAA